MPNVPARPSGANLTDACLDLDNPAEVKRWIVAVRMQASDAIAAGLDATARARRRVLSRAEARRSPPGCRSQLVRAAHVSRSRRAVGLAAPPRGATLKRNNLYISIRSGGLNHLVAYTNVCCGGHHLLRSTHLCISSHTNASQNLFWPKQSDLR